MIDCIIVNWNSGCQLSDAIDSAIKYGAKCIKRVIVIDNYSSDDSVEVAKERSKYLEIDVDYIYNRDNAGFGAACNQGFSISRNEFVLLLNPDARLLDESIYTVLKFMKAPENKKVGICGVQLMNESGELSRSCSRFPNAWGFIAQAVGLVHLIPQLGHVMSDWSHYQTREVDHVIGAFFLIRKSVIEQIGGFDERFFVYLEDLDFSYRAYKAGWASVYLTEAKAFHAGGGTSKQVKGIRLFYSLRSRLLYAFKHFGRVGALSVLLATLFLEPLTRSGYALLRGSWSSLMETWGGYATLYRWLPQWFFKGKTR